MDMEDDIVVRLLIEEDRGDALVNDDSKAGTRLARERGCKSATRGCGISTDGEDIRVRKR